MCGIVGIIGKTNTTNLLIKGLEKLEYRGYDSAGIYVINEKKQDFLIKSEGKVSDLKKQITSNIQGNTGIGHTRWATHGRATQNNAHPHKSYKKQFTIVHNGVIENFEELKIKYLKDINLEGETDSEIAVNLIEYFFEKAKSTKEAFKKTLSVIHGSYAFAFIDKNDPETIYIAKNKSPLLIGVGEGFNVICSDAMAMLSETNKFIEILDGEIATIKAKQILIENNQNKIIHRDPYEVALELNDTNKGNYQFYMLKEIDEQPAVIRQLMQMYIKDQNQIQIDQNIINHIQKSDRIYIIACGTSYNAGLVGKVILEEIANTPTEVHLASEFSYNTPILSKNPFFIFLSQSGETADSRQVLLKISNLNYPSLAITNTPLSTLSREANYTLLLYAGPEIAVASTKAYTAQIALLSIFAKAIGDAKNIQIAKAFNIYKELSMISNIIENIVNKKNDIQKISEKYLSNTNNAFYIGRGMDYYTAVEAALKLKEISYIQAEGVAAGELKHGTIALIEENTPVFGIITNQKTANHTRGNLKEVESRGSNNCIIALQSLSKETDDFIIQDIHQLLTPLVSVIPTQLIAYFASLQRGFNVDQPRNLAKSVTVE